MPIKVYKCEKCEKVVENFNPSINSKDLEKCECGSNLKRLFSDNKIGISFSGAYHNW